MEMSSPDKPTEQRITIIKKGIDRLLSGDAVYKGDLRDRR